MSVAGYPAFDPYQQWLGIPPHEQPANLYRLLGVQLFEPNPAAVAMAADRLLAYLRNITDPAYVPIASRIYEEIVAARTTLTDPYQRSQYDPWLQRTLAGGPMGMMAPGAPLSYAPQAAPQMAPQYGAPAYGMVPGYPAGAMTPTAPATMPEQPAPRLSEPAILGDVGPNPWNMIYWGAGVLTLVVAVSLFRNMNDRPATRKLAASGPTPAASEIAAPNVEPSDAPPETVPSEPPPVETKGPAKAETVAPLPAKPEPKEPPKRRPEMETDTTPEPRPVPKVETKKPEPKKAEPKVEPRKTEPKKTEPKKGEPFFNVRVDTSAGRELLDQVRLALANRDLPQAKRHLEAVKALKLDPLNPEISRLEMLHYNLEQFWGAVRKGIDGLRDVDETVIGQTRVSVVEAAGSKLVLRIDGLNKTFYVDSMSANVSLFLANRYYKESSSAKIFVGSFHAMDSMGDRQKARGLWEAARGAGSATEKEAVEVLLPELAVTPPQGPQTVGTLGIE